MSTITIVHCDRCGERIIADRNKLLTESGRLHNRWFVIDLCHACAWAFEAWLSKEKENQPLSPPRGGAD